METLTFAKSLQSQLLSYTFSFCCYFFPPSLPTPLPPSLPSPFFFLFLLSLTHSSFSGVNFPVVLVPGYLTKHMHRVFPATQRACNSSNNVYTQFLSRLKAAHCCGSVHNTKRRNVGRELEKSWKEHSVLYILCTRDLDYLLEALLFFPVITEESLLLKLRGANGEQGSPSRCTDKRTAMFTKPERLRNAQNTPLASKRGCPLRGPHATSGVPPSPPSNTVTLELSYFTEPFDNWNLMTGRASVYITT